VHITEDKQYRASGDLVRPATPSPHLPDHLTMALSTGEFVAFTAKDVSLIIRAAADPKAAEALRDAIVQGLNPVMYPGSQLRVRPQGYEATGA
jgi:hypothetical protein